MDQFQLFLREDLFLLDSLVYTHMKSEVPPTHEFAVHTSSQGGKERWKLMSKFVQFTSVYFPDRNSHCYDNLKNMKLNLKCELNVSTKVKFSW